MFDDSSKRSKAARAAFDLAEKRGWRDVTLLDIAQASDLPNIAALGKIVKKHYLTWPKSVTL